MAGCPHSNRLWPPSTVRTWSGGQLITGKKWSSHFPFEWLQDIVARMKFWWKQSVVPCDHVLVRSRISCRTSANMTSTINSISHTWPSYNYGPESRTDNRKERLAMEVWDGGGTKTTPTAVYLCNARTGATENECLLSLTLAGVTARRCNRLLSAGNRPLFSL